MKKYWMTTIVVMFALAPMAYGAISDAFEAGYEMNGTPGVAPAYVATDWTAGATAVAQTTWTGTSLVMKGGDASWGANYKHATNPLRPAGVHGWQPTDWGLEYKMRLTNANVLWFNGHYLPLGDQMDAGAWLAPLYGTLWTSAGTAGGSVYTNLTVPANHDWTVFHTYTLTGNNNGDGTTTFNFYVDDIPQVNVTVDNRNSSAGGLSGTLMGSYDGTIGDDIEYDWVRWSTLVPEPVTLSMLALGGLAFLARRRR